MRHRFAKEEIVEIPHKECAKITIQFLAEYFKIPANCKIGKQGKVVQWEEYVSDYHNLVANKEREIDSLELAAIQIIEKIKNEIK